MKKLKLFVILGLTLLLAVGCSMKTEVGMKIAEDKKVTVYQISAMDNDMIDAFLSMSSQSEEGSEQKEYTDEDRWKFIESGDNENFKVPEGYTAERYSKDGYKGYIYSREVGDIESVTAESAETRTNIFQEEKNEAGESEDKILEGILFVKEGNVYKSNMMVDLGEDKAEMDSYKQQGAGFLVHFVVELPTKPLSNNATSVSEDGKTLTFDLLTVSDIEFEFEFPKSESGSKKDDSKKEGSVTTTGNNKSGINPLIIAGIGGGVLLVVVIIVIVALSKKKKAPVAPVAPVTPEAPASPATPEVTVAQVATEAPTAPEVPVTPVVPETPVAPVEPVIIDVPVAPVTPDVPVTPVEVAPVQPEPVTIAPEAPAAPVEPVIIDVPAAPVTPEAPVVPAAPETPVQNTENTNN